MSGAVAKKYVNALMSGCTEQEVVEINEALVLIARAFKLEKFDHIIFSPDVSIKAKEELVLSLMECKNKL